MPPKERSASAHLRSETPARSDAATAARAFSILYLPGTGIEFAARAELPRKFPLPVHDDRLARIMNVLRELSKNLFQLGEFLVVLVNVQDEPDLRGIAHKRTVAFVRLHDEPVALARDRVSDESALLERYKARARNERRGKTRIIQNVKNHSRSGAFAARAAHGDRLRLSGNEREHFASVHRRNSECLRAAEIRIRVLDRCADDDR